MGYNCYEYFFIIFYKLYVYMCVNMCIKLSLLGKMVSIFWLYVASS